MLDDTPHFDLPFRFKAVGNAVIAETVEQDTVDDVSNGVIAVLRTHTGWRPEQPEFGSAELVFNNQPLSLSAIADQVVKSEPRAAVVLAQFPDLLDQLVAHVLVNVGEKEGS